MAMFVRVANNLIQLRLKKKLYVLNWCKIVYDLGVTDGQVYKLGFIFFDYSYNEKNLSRQFEDMNYMSS